VASVAADETLKLWNVFRSPAEACKAAPKTYNSPLPISPVFVEDDAFC